MTQVGLLDVSIMSIMIHTCPNIAFGNDDYNLPIL